MQELINAGFALALGYAGLVLALAALNDIRPVRVVFDAVDRQLGGWAGMAAVAIAVTAPPLAPLLAHWPDWIAYAFAGGVGATGAALIAASILREISWEDATTTFGLGVIFIVIAVVVAAFTWLMGWVPAGAAWLIGWAIAFLGG
ncbi:MAG: hypothetical protein NXI21_01845 [Alphaproteobacteria bacterium]|nr:hypothetical protein [Alphaproteobacteria bacterium]